MGRLAILNGARHGEIAELSGDEILIGRTPDCDLHLPDAAVSARHARLVRRTSGWAVEDLDSTNGTRVNGVVIDQYFLENGDEIICGSVALRFESRPRPLPHIRGPSSMQTAPSRTDYAPPPVSGPPDRTAVDTTASPGKAVASNIDAVRQISRQAAARIQRLLDRTRRDEEAWNGWVADCALFVRALRLVDWTRLPPEQQRMIRELVDETQPEAVLRNMQAALEESRETTRDAYETAAALSSSLAESALSVHDALHHARALTDADAAPLSSTGDGEALILPVPAGAAVHLLGLLLRLGEYSDRGLVLRAFGGEDGIRLRVDGAPQGIEALSRDVLEAIEELLATCGGALTLRPEPRGTSVDITIPW